MGVDMALVNQKREECKQRDAFLDAQYLKFDKDGVYVLRILPPYGDLKQFWVEHNSCWVGPRNRKVTPAGGENCPLQKRIAALLAAGDEASKKQAQKLRPKPRFAMAVIDRSAEGKGPQLFELPSKTFAAILTVMSDPDYGDITDPQNGVDIQITYTKEGKTGFPEYAIHPKRTSTPLSSDPKLLVAWTSENWLERWGCGRISDNEYIQACLDGTDEAYLAARKQQAEQQAPAQQDHQQSSASAAPALPASAPPAAAPALSPIVTAPFAIGTKFWTVKNGAVVETTVEAVTAQLQAGAKLGEIQLMAMDQRGGWLTAATMGFQVQMPSPPPPAAPSAALPAAMPPPPPASPPAAPPASPPAVPPAMAAPPPAAYPPPASDIPFDVPQSEEAALAQQMAAFGQQPQRSVVGDDLRAHLGR